jgi:threonine dehydrogenase-like Zn-dependent dehydrogenase
MKALCWTGTNSLKTETVADPVIQDPRDVIVKVSLSSTCGSDLHYIHGILPTMKDGDILGHEFMGEIVEIGSAVRRLKVGDRIVAPSIVSCGTCEECSSGHWCHCDISNPNAKLQVPLTGFPTAAFYGCSHMYGGLPGSHAQYIRVPYGDVGCFNVPDGLRDDQALFISDAAPTAMIGTEWADIRPGDTVAVWGCGAVGLLVQQCAFLKQAARVIAIDRVPARLAMAAKFGSETIDFSQADVFDTLLQMTRGRGPDRCIDAVGLEAQGTGIGGAYDKVKQTLHLETDRGEALRQALKSCKRNGTVSILGIYSIMDKFPLATIINKNLTIRGGIQNGHQHIPVLLEMAQSGVLDASYLATHRYSLDDGVKAYDVFKHKEDGCLRAVFVP